MAATAAVFFSFTGIALAAPVSNDGLWIDVKPTAISGPAVSQILLKSHRLLELDKALMAQLLEQAPMELTEAARTRPTIIMLPMADGTFARFRVEQSPVMATRLAAMFPEIKTYRGQGLDDPSATTRFDVTPAGFHAIVLSSRATVIIEPGAGGSAGQYAQYTAQLRGKPEGTGIGVVEVYFSP